jgi:hypothetical protein
LGRRWERASCPWYEIDVYFWLNLIEGLSGDGSLAVVPGSHLRLGYQAWEGTAREARGQRLIASEPGDMIVIDGRTIRSTAPSVEMSCLYAQITYIVGYSDLSPAVRRQVDDQCGVPPAGWWLRFPRQAQALRPLIPDSRYEGPAH